MNVKSAFLNEILNEEVYVEQPKGFEDPHYPHHMFKLKGFYMVLNKHRMHGMKD